MPTVKRHTFCGRRYRILYTDPDVLARMVAAEAKRHGEEPERLDGLTDAPDAPNKAVRIARGMPPQRLLETLIHEGLHACNWSLAEDWVHEAGRDIARLLWRSGWRPKP